MNVSGSEQSGKLSCHIIKESVDVVSLCHPTCLALEVLRKPRDELELCGAPWALELVGIMCRRIQVRIKPLERAECALAKKTFVCRTIEGIFGRNIGRDIGRDAWDGSSCYGPERDIWDNPHGVCRDCNMVASHQVTTGLDMHCNSGRALEERCAEWAIKDTFFVRQRVSVLEKNKLIGKI